MIFSTAQAGREWVSTPAPFSKEEYTVKILRSQGKRIRKRFETVGVSQLSVRAKFILHSVLLVLALLATVLAAKAAMGAFVTLQHQNALTRTGDVRTIRPWMTVPYIAHEYHVPEHYLYGALNITQKYPEHSTLQAIAIHSHRPVSELIHTLQTTITTYRKQHPFRSPYQPRLPSYSFRKQPVSGGIAY